MSDEILNDDEHKDKKILGNIEGGEFLSCPNYQHLPQEERAQMAEEAVASCGKALIGVYTSLGISGSVRMEMTDAISGRQFTMTFESND